ncbi:hypothetical protein BV210_18470 (plasmid) [Halorientalis sp. IM1011]|nr:hypothetical protein BV210_18470 [Halorientalis sp. IM1011]
MANNISSPIIVYPFLAGAFFTHVVQRCIKEEDISLFKLCYASRLWLMAVAIGVVIAVTQFRKLWVKVSYRILCTFWSNWVEI